MQTTESNFHNRPYKKKLIRNTLFSSIGSLWNVIVAFFLFPFVVHHIGEAAAGIWFLTASFTGYLGVLNRGVSPSVTKYIAEWFAKQSNEKVNKFVNTGFLTFLIFGIFAFFVMLVVGRYGLSYFKIEPSLFHSAKLVIYLTGAVLLLSFPCSNLSSVLTGLQEYDKLAFSRISGSIVRILLTIYLLSIGYGVVSLVVINLCANCITWCLQGYFLKRKFRFIRIGKEYLDWKIAKQITSFGGVTFLIAICAILIFQTDRIILGVFLSVSVVTFYTAIKKIYDAVSMIPGFFLHAIMPLASELEASDKMEINQRLFIKATKYSFAIFIPIATFVMLNAKPILTAWVGEKYATFSLGLQLLIAHSFFTFNHHAGSQILVGINKIRFILSYYLKVVVLNLVLSIILVRWIGWLGVVLGTTIPFVIFEFLYIRFLLYTLKVNWRYYVRNVILKTFPPIVIIAPLILLIGNFVNLNNLLALAILGFINVLVYFTLFYFIGLDQNERIAINTYGYLVRQKLNLKLTTKEGRKGK